MHTLRVVPIAHHRSYVSERSEVDRFSQHPFLRFSPFRHLTIRFAIVDGSRGPVHRFGNTNWSTPRALCYTFRTTSSFGLPKGCSFLGGKVRNRLDMGYLSPCCDARNPQLVAHRHGPRFWLQWPFWRGKRFLRLHSFYLSFSEFSIRSLCLFSSPRTSS